MRQRLGERVGVALLLVPLLALAVPLPLPLLALLVPLLVPDA